jgi:gas vesicle protein
MNNRKMAAGILTIVGAAIAVALILSSKKGRNTGKNLLKKGDRLKEDLKGKFNDFVDRVSDKVQGVLK